MHREHLAAAMTAVAMAAGITLPDGVGVHFCRHVAITRFQNSGLTQQKVDLMTGHAAGVRATYTHGDRVALYRAVRERL